MQDETTERPREDYDTTKTPGVEPPGGEIGLFNLFNLDNKMQLIVILIVVVGVVTVVCLVICLIRCNNQAPASKVIKNGKTIKSSTPSDYYFNSTNVFDRRPTNGQLATITAATSRTSLRPSALIGNESDRDESTKPLNVRLNPLNEMSSLNRKNSFRSSLSSSTHHLFNTANGRSTIDFQSSHESASAAVANNNGTTASTATIDRKRMMKTCVEPYLDYPRLNHHSASFTRLNGTLERKRRSRTDLNTLDRSYFRNMSTNEIDRQSNGNVAYLPSQNGHSPIVIMQSSC